MKSAAWLITTALVASFFTACGPPPVRVTEVGPGTGPFDANGNYIEDWADDPSKWRRPTSGTTAIASNDRPPSYTTPIASKPPSTPIASTPPPPKPKPKPKPQITRHTVKRGDTLSGIAKRYGSSVTAIRKENKISGSLIFPGQRLTIPRR